MHKRKIVHRDLKLENLLLDKNRNIIVTDFGFANQFSSAADDLMATTCGSPCYAAPELVVNAGLYAGSAVDIWSCGVILYAMLCGFLPFDDDPSNPDSDNINQLYRYILSTHLMFPAYVSLDARDLLQRMLVPDPAKRCSLDYIIRHPWLNSHRDFLRKDASQIRMDALSASRLSSTPSTPVTNIENTPNIALTNSVSTTVQSSSDKKLAGENQPASRKTHIPVASRDRFAPVANDRFITESSIEKSVSPSSTANGKTSAFRHFSIGRSSATTTPVDRPTVHATVTPTTTTRNSKVPSFITRKPVKQEDEAITIEDIVQDTDNNNNPEKSLSSPLNPQDTKIPTISTFGSIRRNQRRGTDKFLSFFTSGRASHIPVSANNNCNEDSIFNMVKDDDNEEQHTEKMNESHTEDNLRLAANEDDNEEDYKVRTLQSPSETSTIGGSTPSLCISSAMSDPSSPLSPNGTPQQQNIIKSKPAVTINHRSRSALVHIDTSTSSISLNDDNAATSPTIVGDTIEEEVEDEGSADEAALVSAFSFRDEETSSSISRQQYKSRDRGSSMSAASILSDNSMSINSSILSFKDTPKRTPPIYSAQKMASSSLITRQQQQQQQQQHYPSDNNSSILSADQHDNASISSAGTSPRPEVSTSGKYNTKSVVSNAMGDGGRKAMAAVRRSIYRKHRSQPPPHSETSSQTSSQHAIKEPTISFGRSRFEETGNGYEPTSHRNTWSSGNMMQSSSELTSARVEPALTSNNKSSTTNNTAPPKKTGKKMMDWIKKKSHAKEAKKDMHTIQPTDKLNSSVQITSKSRKQSTKTDPPAVTVTPNTNVTVNNKYNAQATISRKNVVSILEPTRRRRISILPSVSPPPLEKKIEESVVVIPTESSRRNNRALSGNENDLPGAIKISIDERIQIHQGAIDRSALTSQPPADIIKDIKRILRILGIEAKTEVGTSPFILKCSRRKAKSFIAAELLKKKDNKNDEDDDNEDFLDEVYKSNDDQFIINDSNITTTSETSLLAPSHVDSQSVSSASSSGVATDARGLEPIYGDASIDNGDEVRFAVEVCRFKNLPGLYIVDIRRLRGNVWAYKFLYHKLIDFLNAGRDSGYVL
ncbi:hypothetical protein BDF21DRAFT_416130 [Thamnidium elegans]|nr:hypothetical protein BDF21DRAFT_416130 [Thamnidium elegans]